MREAEKHQEQREEDHRVMSKHHDAREQREMQGTMGDRYGGLAPVQVPERQHMAAQNKCGDGRVDETATAAFQPNWASMKALSQFQIDATISTGGAA